MMNIYCVVISTPDEDDGTFWTEAENGIEAVGRVYIDSEEDIPNLLTAKELTIKVSLTQEGMTMDEFESAFPDFFFT